MSWYNEDLRSVLDEKYPAVGKENRKDLGNNITLCTDPYGSHRFVKYFNGQAIAAIQVMSDGQRSHVAKAYTHPNFRRKGIATELVNAARRMFPNLTFSSDLSPSGEAFVNSQNR